MKLSQVVFVAMITLAFSQLVFSQNANSVSFNGELAVSIGEFSDVADVGLGGSATFQRPISENFALLGRVGFILWKEKEISGGGLTLSNVYSAVPLMGGGVIYFGDGNIRFFGMGEVGVHIFKVNSELSIVVPFENNLQRVSMSATDTKISFAPGIGVELGESTKLTIAARYNYVADELSYLGLRIGILFGDRE